MPTSYVKGSAPAIPNPKSEGREFLGWTWGDQTTPTKDQSVIAGAFASGGEVALTANWGAPEANYFFSGASPLDAGGGAQSHVIKVRISDEQKTLKSVSFADNDRTGLLKKDQLAGKNVFWVNSSASEPAGDWWTSWNGTINQDIQLVDVGDGYGLYVGIKVPAGAVDAGSVVSSYTDGSYVASLVTMNYTFAA